MGLAVAVLVSACAPLPDMPPKPSPKDVSIYETEHSFSAGANAQSAWPTEQWWLPTTIRS
ncbi:hypothetical protein [Paraburkholderia hospita]|uniref:hypothetical protein n=1 Tax=Paraburkholderia hospita TaxID=169430 RepID=UPI001F410A79|nr:hypothetical protein [Paraburkholderia hospita]